MSDSDFDSILREYADEWDFDDPGQAFKCLTECFEGLVATGRMYDFSPAEIAMTLDERVDELGAEVERLRREQKDMLLSLIWRTGKAEGQMRKMQQSGHDDQHSRLREGRYEALSRTLSALSDIASVEVSRAALSGGGEEDQ